MALEYILITAAHNEEAFIELTIKSVISQTILPVKWIIVSDGSTDRTDDIVKSYIKKYEWIELIRLPERKERHFAGKANAFNIGYESAKKLKPGIIGNLDGDISFCDDYFEYLLGKFKNMQELGVAGTHYIEGKFHSFNDSYINVHHVNGQCQLFRRQCLAEIGGYVPSKNGGIDWIAGTTARMKGWKTYSFEDRVYTHHRTMGTANGNLLQSRFNYGKKDYFLGGHPLWEIFRGFFQMTKKPYVIGGLLILLGYSWAFIIQMEKPISEELNKFIKKEQIHRLKDLFANKLIKNGVSFLANR